MTNVLTIFSCFACVTLSMAQMRFSSGEITATTVQLTGDPAAWSVVLSYAERNEASNSFSLSTEAVASIKTFSVLHTKVRDGKLLFAKLLKAGARVFAPEELQRATAHEADYTAGVGEGNVTALTRSGELYLRSLALIRKEIEEKRNETIDALIAEKNGDVTKRRGFLGSWNSASKGDLLAQTDGLKTGGAGSAQLAFTDGVEVMIDPNSTVVIRESTMDRLDNSVRRDIVLEKGSLLTKLTESAKERNNFTFQAGSSESQVRSGKFWASAVEERRVKMSNYDGSIDIAANKKSVRLKSNEGTIVEKGKAPMDPIPLLPSPQLVWNGIDSVVYSDYLVLEWDSVRNSTGYKVEVSPVKEFNTAVSVFSPIQNRIRLDKIELGVQFVRLTAIDRFGLRGMESPLYSIMRVEDKLPPAIYVEGWITDRRYTALKELTITGSTEADATLRVNNAPVQLSVNGNFSVTVQMEQSEKQLTLKATDRSGNVRERLLSIVPIDVKKVTQIDWNCPEENNVLLPSSETISARGAAYPSMRVTVRHGEQMSTVQTDSQGNWAITIQRLTGADVVLVFESISDNIVVASKTYRVE